MMLRILVCTIFASMVVGLVWPESFIQRLVYQKVHSIYGYEKYSQSSLRKHLSSGRKLLICFWADWDLYAQMEKRAVNSIDVEDALVRTNTTVLIADTTLEDRENTDVEQAVERCGITWRSPAYRIVVPKQHIPLVLPNSLTANELVQYLDLANEY